MRKFVFITIFLFSIFLTSPITADAKVLSECDNDELIDYFSKIFVFNDFLLSQTDSSFRFSPISSGYSIVYNGNQLQSLTPEGLHNNAAVYYNISKSTDTSNLSPAFGRINYNSSTSSLSFLLLSSFDVKNINDDTIYFSKNYNLKSDITPEPDPSPSPEPTEENNSFTREEFLLIPFLLCILICMLFFKWCFPMKGGKKI